MSAFRPRKAQPETRSRPHLVALAVLALGLFLGPSSASATSNDTMAGAQGPLTVGVIGSIATQNDIDWYFMWASAYTQLDVAITGLGPEDSCQDWDLALIDPDGRELDSVHVGFNHVRHILYTLQAPGTYYLQVDGFVCAAVGNYRIDLTASPGLLTSPPYVPPSPPPSSPGSGYPSHSSGPSSACRQARSRVTALNRQLSRFHTSHQRRRLRIKLHQARKQAQNAC